MKHLLKSLNQRPIALYPAYIKITGSLAGGALLSQCMYWFGKKDKFHKTDAEFIDELGLTPNEMRGAKTKVKNLKFVKITRKGVPAKTWYSIDWDAYQDAMTVQFSEIHQTGENTGFLGDPSLVKFTKLDSWISPNKLSGFHSTFYSNTKTTTETTSESSKKTPPANYKQIDLSNLDPLVDIDAAKEWIDHRIAKKCRLAKQSTFDRQMHQAIKSSNETFNELNLSPTDVIYESIDAGWQGIAKPDWLRNRLGANHGNQRNQKRETTGERINREANEAIKLAMGNDEDQIPESMGGAQHIKLVR